MNINSAKSALYHPPKIRWLAAAAEAGLLVAVALVLAQVISA